MSASNAGTGQPCCFKCAKCRHATARTRYGSNEYWEASRRGVARRVVLTGRTKKVRCRGGLRSGSVGREYRCRDCGHVGWSNHKELERKSA